ncbi:hypothetical protein ACF06L_18400 [Streptomyces sp. NPDC015408]|uniref:restriction endonuclease subunit S n=1 Tax=Streptomyces sp. NPDC015408 TaxID=3364956 RepID=UPI003701D534
MDFHPLSDVLYEDSHMCDLKSDKRYPITGIYSFGRGLIKRPTIRGEETSYPRMAKLRSGQVVMSKLNAWEGALAVVDDLFDGTFVSPEYPVFSVKEENADIGYVRHMLAWHELWNRLTPRGSMVRRKRTTPATLLATEVPLPDLDEQRRISEKLDAALHRQVNAFSTATSRAELVLAAIDSREAQIFERGLKGGWDLKPLNEVADVNPRTKRPEGKEVVAFIPMAAVSGITGTVEKPESVAASDVGSGYKAFRRNDVIFARITPCMQNGKSAVFQDGTSEYGFGSTEFHVIRPRGAVDSRWIHRIVRSRNFREAAALHMTGTAGQQRVPAKYLQNVQIPIPGSIDQQREAIKELDDLQRVRLRFSALHNAQLDDLKSLRPAILNAAFSGRL